MDVGIIIGSTVIGLLLVIWFTLIFNMDKNDRKTEKRRREEY